eukprot:scaffold46362_cov68-Phaeocystis_antarctica.AAC.6
MAAACGGAAWCAWNTSVCSGASPLRARASAEAFAPSSSRTASSCRGGLELQVAHREVEHGHALVITP